MPNPEEMIDPHIPSCVPYSVTDVLNDITSFAAKVLVLNGRLIYWLPTTDESFFLFFYFFIYFNLSFIIIFLLLFNGLLFYFKYFFYLYF